MRAGRRKIWLIAAFVVLMIGGITQSDLKQGDMIKSVPTERKVVALTFDDGPHPLTTPQLLAVLKEKQVRATFFVLGQNVEKNPALVAQAVADGHEIGNHAYSHKILSKSSERECVSEIEKTEAIIMKVAPKPVLFRPPGGGYNSSVLRCLWERGYTVVGWSVDPRDWSRPKVGQVVDVVLKSAKPGSIILMHDGQWPLPTPEAAAIIIDGLRDRGYELVTVSEILQCSE